MCAGAVNRGETPRDEADLSRTIMSVTLILALAALIVWALALAFMPITGGAIHLLLALGTTLLVRWWALRE
jgi:hypothetical protein